MHTNLPSKKNSMSAVSLKRYVQTSVLCRAFKADNFRYDIKMCAYMHDALGPVTHSSNIPYNIVYRFERVCKWQNDPIFVCWEKVYT